MTEHRTVAAERDLPRVRQWIDDAVRHAVNEAAQALNAIRYWCDQTETVIGEHAAEEGDDRQCEWCAALRLSVAQVRALLPAVPETSERRADDGQEVNPDGHASDAGRRPGLVTPDP